MGTSYFSFLIMTCDITLFRESISSHPEKKGVTLVEREELWSDSSWTVGELLASENEVGPNQMFWTDPTEVAECASGILESNTDELTDEDIEVLEDLIETCNKEETKGFSYTMIIDW